MGSKRTQTPVQTPQVEVDPRPRGEQAIGQQLYQQIRQAIILEDARPQPRRGNR